MPRELEANVTLDFTGGSVGLDDLECFDPADDDTDELAAILPLGPLPRVELFGGPQGIRDTAAELGKYLAEKKTHFLRAGVVVKARFTDDETEEPLRPVKPVELMSDLETVARLCKRDRNRMLRPATCSKTEADAILHCEAFRDALPRLNLISECPVLVERDGKLRTISGYDQESGIMARGKMPAHVPISRAVQLLRDLLSDFRFVHHSDESRAMASLIVPALVMGNLIKERAPIEATCADAPQSGKGYRNKMIAAVYNQLVVAVAQSAGRVGVGSIEQSFDRAVASGSTFISLDNIRGKIDSQKFESFATEDTYIARPSFFPETRIDPRTHIVMLTSNSAHLTLDLVHRCSIVRIQKHKQTRSFQQYSIEGHRCDVLNYIRAHQELYLGAVFAIVSEWHRLGKKRTDENRHDRREWAQSLDWIVQNIFKMAPLLDDHDEVKQQMSNPVHVWLRDTMQAVVDANMIDEPLTATDLHEILTGGGDLDPGAAASARRQIGRKMKSAFRSGPIVQIDAHEIERTEESNDHAGTDKTYTVRLRRS